jgi:hypothetical protein
MSRFDECPSCAGLLPKSSAACPHCDYRPSIARLVGLGVAAAIGFSAFAACDSTPGGVMYGPCLQPDGNFCGAMQFTDAGQSDGGDGDADAGDGG